MRAEDYERGYYVATQRAISRQELELPLDYGKTANDEREPYLKPFIDGAQYVEEAIANVKDGLRPRTGYFEQARTEGG